MKKVILALALFALAGCACNSDKCRNPANDGYVPWWVQDGVPNSEGVIVK